MTVSSAHSVFDGVLRDTAAEALSLTVTAHQCSSHVSCALMRSAPLRVNPIFLPGSPSFLGVHIWSVRTAGPFWPVNSRHGLCFQCNCLLSTLSPIAYIGTASHPAFLCFNSRKLMSSPPSASPRVPFSLAGKEHYPLFTVVRRHSLPTTFSK